MVPTYVEVKSFNGCGLRDVWKISVVASYFLAMASLFTYFLFWGEIHVIFGRPILDFYKPSDEAPNVLKLECIDSGGRASSNARFKFYNSTGALLRDQPTDTNRNYLTYNIARDSEAIVRCTIGEEHSGDISFAGNLFVVSDRYSC